MSISAIYLNESLLGAGRDQCVGIDALALKLSKSFILSSVASEGFSVLITVPCRKQVLERVMGGQSHGRALLLQLSEEC